MCSRVDQDGMGAIPHTEASMRGRDYLHHVGTGGPLIGNALCHEHAGNCLCDIPWRRGMGSKDIVSVSELSAPTGLDSLSLPDCWEACRLQHHITHVT